MKIFIIILIEVLISFFVKPGYQILTQDQRIYIPLILNRLKPEILMNDFLLSAAHKPTDFMFFDDLIIFLTNLKIADIYIVLFGMTILTRFVFFFSLTKLILFFTGDKKFSLLSPLLVISGTVYGAATVTMDAMLLPRDLGLAVGLLSLSYLLEQRIFISSFFLFISCLIHPLSALSLIIIEFFLYKEKRHISLVILSLGIVYLFDGSLLKILADKKTIFQTLNLWREYLPYLFVFRWSFFAFLLLWASGLFLFMSKSVFQKLEKRKKIIIKILIFVPIGFFLFSVLAVDLFNISFIAKLQLGRALIFIKIISTLGFAFYCYQAIKNNKKDYWLFFLTIAFFTTLIFREFFMFIFLPALIAKLFKKSRVSMIIFLSTCFVFLILAKKYRVEYKNPTLNFSIYPSLYTDHDFVSTCAWIDSHTLSSDVFLTFPFSDKTDGIRVLCQRSVFVSYKDSGQMMYDNDYALEWKKRIDLVTLQKTPLEIIRAIRKTEKVDYIFSEKKLDGFKLSFHGANYFIYLP